MRPHDEFTVRLLAEAGIAPGMRVLDAGCSSGMMSLLIASIVGETGEVVGVDKHDTMIHVARELTEESGHENVTYVEGELDEVVPTLGQFDAVAGRQILMYLANPVATLGVLRGALKPGGVAVFQESDATVVPGSIESMPLHDQVTDWIWKTAELEGADLHMGFKLPASFHEALFTVDSFRAEPVLEVPGTENAMVFKLRTMLPHILWHQVASVRELDLETLAFRLSEERTPDRVYISDMAFGIAGRKPGGSS
jgi:SAM-dependent methyltransferase